MRVLAVGDVVSDNGCRFLRKVLPGIKREYKIDFCVVNGENSHISNAITPESADFIFSVGADVITNGNHTFRRKEIEEYLEERDDIVRPANLLQSQFGKGYTVVDMGRCSVAVINLMGAAFTEGVCNPFECIDGILEEIGDEVKIILVDFHAEATGEKRAMGFYLDGRVSAIWGTHTHVQTSDECILPEGTGYITDLGMTGTFVSCLGVKPECVIERLKSGEKNRFEHIDGPCVLGGCIFDIDSNGVTTSVERILIKE